MLWEVRILLVSASFKFRPYPCLCYVADMHVFVYVLCWSQWPDFVLSSSNLFYCSGHLAFCLIEFGVARFAQWLLLRVCGTAWLGEGTVLHTFNTLGSSSLRDQPTGFAPWLWELLQCFDVYAMVSCECFGMQFIHKFTVSVLINKQC